MKRFAYEEREVMLTSKFVFQNAQKNVVSLDDFPPKPPPHIDYRVSTKFLKFHLSNILNAVDISWRNSEMT